MSLYEMDELNIPRNTSPEIRPTPEICGFLALGFNHTFSLAAEAVGRQFDAGPRPQNARRGSTTHIPARISLTHGSRSGGGDPSKPKGLYGERTTPQRAQHFSRSMFEVPGAMGGPSLYIVSSGYSGRVENET